MSKSGRPPASTCPNASPLGWAARSLVDPQIDEDRPGESTLIERVLVFGGSTTCTHAPWQRLIDLSDPGRLEKPGLSSTALKRFFSHASVGRPHEFEADALIAVGGSFRPPDGRCQRVVHVPHQGVANAVGAAIAQVSGEVDQVFQGLKREEALERARKLAAERAVRAGASQTSLAVVEQEDIPLSYLPGNSLRVRVRVVGDIARMERPG
jgi:hypothetical protein